MTATASDVQRHVQDIRHADVIALRNHFPPSARVLELGGGNGYQASVVAGWGCDVASIDIAAPPAGSPTFFPVQLYDGSHIPFPDQTFDVVYSSCVLEHVPDLLPLLRETRRVLKPQGTAVHIVPSAIWRFWTSVAHYPHLLKRLAGLGRQLSADHIPATSAPPAPPSRLGSRLRRLLWAPAHGEYPSAVSELYYYSRRRWTRVFAESGFAVRSVTGNGLFHTGYRVLPFLSPRPRRALAVVLGSSTHVFALRHG